jgi:aspartate/methionine/tyrosine aminotransferase
MFSDRTNWRLSPNRFTQALEEARVAGKNILDLSASNPTRVGLHYEEGAILCALASPKSIDYDPQSKGLRGAREAVAAYYRDEHGVTDLDPERLVLTSSTSEGYSYVFGLLCNPGDELLVPKPSYPLFDFLADLEDVKLVPYPLIYDHGWQMDFPSLERAVTPRTRGVVIVHPNNPTGSYVHADELAPLNAFCRTHKLALIVDEVFLDYAHGGKKRCTFAANDEVLTFTLSGLSKVSALPQMKVAWVAANGPKAESDAAMSRLEVIADTYLSMNAPMQWAMPVLLQQRQSIQKQLLDRVLANLAELDHQLAAQKTCQRLNVEGGWYAVLRVPATKSDEDWAIELLREKSVLVHPGHFYDFPGAGHLVLSLITPTEEFERGIAGALHELLIAD